MAARYFFCGWMDADSPPAMSRSLRHRAGVRSVHIGDKGHFYYNSPWYLDAAEDETVICLKLGKIHDGRVSLSANDLLTDGERVLQTQNITRFSGNGVVIFLSKARQQCMVYRNLLSAPILYYTNDRQPFLVTDNLRGMMDLLPKPEANTAVLPQHFIYRAVYGGQTYLQDVNELLTGELLTWQGHQVVVKLVRRINDLFEPGRRVTVNRDSVELAYQQIKNVLSIYLAGNNNHSATMLSGGVDSSLLQVIINELGHKPFPSFSFVLESSAFSHEMDYVKNAVDRLGTRHSFHRISPTEYRDSLIQSIAVLGQPVPDDVRACFFSLAKNISAQHPLLTHWVHGQIADGLAGISNSQAVVQGDKYRSWPVHLLWILGIMLSGVSQSKSYGAVKASETLRFARQVDSPQHHLNSVGMYTHWQTVLRCFSNQELIDAMAGKRLIVDRYLDSDFFVERMNTLDLLTDGVQPAGIVRQIGVYYGGEFLFPYGDEEVVKAVYAYDPLSRYVSNGYVKPILKMALETRASLSSIHNAKGWSGVGDDLWRWMQSGPLRELVDDIERPGFISRKDFALKIENPDWFTWNLLTYDLFRRLMDQPADDLPL